MSAAVSVICTFLNAESTLAATLESLHRQTVPDAQFILVDDGSRDGSAVIAARVSASDPRFTQLANPNPGRIRALNLALRQTDAEYIAILDADDVAHPLWLADGLTAMRQEPGYAVISFERLIIRDLDSPDFTSTAHPLKPEVSEATRNLARGNVIGHSGVLMRRELLLKAGLYDESLPHLEDYDLWIRLAKAGYALGRCNLVRIAKRYHHGQKFGHALRVMRASWRMQLRAVMTLDPSYANFVSLAWSGAKDFSRQPRRALLSWARGR